MRRPLTWRLAHRLLPGGGSRRYGRAGREGQALAICAWLSRGKRSRSCPTCVPGCSFLHPDGFRRASVCMDALAPRLQVRPRTGFRMFPRTELEAHMARFIKSTLLGAVALMAFVGVSTQALAQTPAK